MFPFIYKGKEYNQCTFQKGDVKAWCSTKVDGNGKHVGGQRQWGYCEKECPVQGRVNSVQHIICVAYRHNLMKKSNTNSIFFRCQAEVAITNLSRCNLGEDACNLSCTTTGHASGKC